MQCHKVTTNESYVSVLNHCFDDIEKFIIRLQQAVAAIRELQAKRKAAKRAQKLEGGHNSGAADLVPLTNAELAMLNARARGPNEDDYFEILSKFKLAFNLLAKLKGCIHEPNAPELVHFLFTPLAIIIESARNAMPPIDPTLVGIPYLNQDALELLSNCCTSKESDMWISLGPNWTQTIDMSLLKASRLPSSFQPIFSDGWAPIIGELELIGLVAPPKIISNDCLKAEINDHSQPHHHHHHNHQNERRHIAGNSYQNNNNNALEPEMTPSGSGSSAGGVVGASFSQPHHQEIYGGREQLQGNGRIIKSSAHKSTAAAPTSGGGGNKKRTTPLNSRSEVVANHHHHHHQLPVVDDETLIVDSPYHNRMPYGGGGYLDNNSAHIDESGYRVAADQQLLSSSSARRFSAPIPENQQALRRMKQQQALRHQQAADYLDPSSYPQQQLMLDDEDAGHLHQQKIIDLQQQNGGGGTIHHHHHHSVNDDYLELHNDLMNDNYNARIAPSSSHYRRSSSLGAAAAAGNPHHHQQNKNHSSSHQIYGHHHNQPILPNYDSDYLNEVEHEAMLLDLGPAQTEWFYELQSRGALIVRVLFTREANNDKELSVSRGEILEILDDSRKWWRARNIDLQIAHVPHTIVAIMHGYQTLDELLANNPSDPSGVDDQQQLMNSHSRFSKLSDSNQWHGRVEDKRNSKNAGAFRYF